MPAADLEQGVVSRLRSIHAVKSGALAMFGPMLAIVARERDASGTPQEVSELLGRMHGAFSNHREETAAQVVALELRLRDLQALPAGRAAGALRLGARAWVKVGSIRGTNHGANARNAFVFEHLEIASLKLLEQLALRSDDDGTAEIVRTCLAQDEAMAATINRNWTNVLTLVLPAD